MRTFLLIYCFLIVVSTASAQDGNTVRDERSVVRVSPTAPPIQQSAQPDAGLLFLPGFRDYFLAGAAEDREAIRHSAMMIGEGVWVPDEKHPSVMRDYLIMRGNLGVHLWRRDDGLTLLKMLGRMLLQEAAQFGYIYAREKVRKQSLSEMDYLYLPQGPGVLRSSGEARNSALNRGEMQSYKIWYDLYHEAKNKPPCDGNKP